MRIKSAISALGADPSGVFHPALALARGAVLFYLCVLPFGHNAALKNLAQGAMLAGLFWLVASHRFTADWRSPILRVIGGLVLVLLATAVFGTDPLDSLGELRKHFLPALLLLLLVPPLFKDEGWMRCLLSFIALAFMVRAGLTLFELAHYFPDLDAGRAAGKFIKGFSLDAGLYLPALMALLLLGGRWRWLAPLGLLAVLGAMLLVQSRTPLVAVAIALVVMLISLRQWRTLIVFVAAAALGGGAIVVNQAQLAERMATTFNPQTYEKALDTKNYQGAEGLAARIPIWAGVLEIGAKRPISGYGFGWKKLAGIAVDDGYVARWQARENDAFAAQQVTYFSQPASTVNPHNLYLQVYFESGLLGVAAYLLMLLVLFAQALQLVWRGRALSRIVGALVLAYLVDHVVLGLSNGLLIGLGPSMALIGLLETVRRSEKEA